MLALAARHVVAAAVLLDGRVAFGALLCVRRYPVRRLGVVGALLEPLLDQIARCGLVVRQDATEAKPVAAGASNGGDDLVQVLLLHLALDGVLAIRCRAPLQRVPVLHVCPVQQFVVSLRKARGAPGSRRDLASMMRLHPSDGHWIRGCLAFLADLLPQVVTVAVDAIAVATLEGEGLEALPFLAADIAHEPGDGLGDRGPRAFLREPRGFEHLARSVHVVLDQALSIPAEVPQEEWRPPPSAYPGSCAPR